MYTQKAWMPGTRRVPAHEVKRHAVQQPRVALAAGQADVELVQMISALCRPCALQQVASYPSQTAHATVVLWLPMTG